MAVQRKGWRMLRARERRFYWRTRLVASDAGPALAITIVGNAAFKSGVTGQRLSFALPRGCTLSPAAIRFAIEHTPGFTGEAGVAHASLMPATWEQLRVFTSARGGGRA